MLTNLPFYKLHLMNTLALILPLIFCPENCCLLFTSAAYSNALQNRFFHGSMQYGLRSLEQSDLCSYCLQYRLPKTSADDIFRYIFFLGALRVNLTAECSLTLKAPIRFASDNIFKFKESAGRCR